MSVQAAITALTSIEAGLSGIRTAHDKTPEKLGELPCFINYPRRGTVTPAPGSGCTMIKGLHTVVAELHVARKILPHAEGVARPYIDSFVKAVWADPTLGGTVNTVNEIRYEYGRLEFGRETHLGVRFEIDFKLQEAVT